MLFLCCRSVCLTEIYHAWQLSYPIQNWNEFTVSEIGIIDDELMIHQNTLTSPTATIVVVVVTIAIDHSKERMVKI